MPEPTRIPATPPLRRRQSRPPRPTARASASETASPAPTQGEPSPTAATATPKPVAKADGSMTSPDFGVQAFLWWRPEVADRDLQLVQEAGFNWVKQLVSWQDVEGAGKGQYDWTNLDRIVEQAEQHGLKLIVRVSQDPDRPFWAGDPPENAGHFADFLTAMASRYKGRIQAYQVWNEPNLAREWGGRRPDPAGYAKLLKLAYSAIKGADPKRHGYHRGHGADGTDTEIAMPDIKFYDQMYEAMKGNSDGYFDMLGVHAAGFAAAPEVSPDETRLTNRSTAASASSPSATWKISAKSWNATVTTTNASWSWNSAGRPTIDPIHRTTGTEPARGSTKRSRATTSYELTNGLAEHWQPWIALMSAIYMPDVELDQGHRAVLLDNHRPRLSGICICVTRTLSCVPISTV